MRTIITLAAAAVSFGTFAGPVKISKQEYVDQWSSIAIEQMMQYNIPASITMAQGILESGNGNSDLATKGNNHFGIKCHGWAGKKMYKDDDAKNECFRVYKDGKDSYEDHSKFLKTYERYSFLFDYDVKDYKSWAKGLKQAGYATNPKYPELLIGIIEDMGLDKLDKVGKMEVIQPTLELITYKTEKHDVNEHERGNVRFVIAEKGDTYYSIAQEFGLTLNQLYRFNAFATNKDYLSPGDVIYIQRKKSGNIFKKEEVVLKNDMTIDEISQQYAVARQALIRMNAWSENVTVISKGQKVTLQ